MDEGRNVAGAPSGESGTPDELQSSVESAHAPSSLAGDAPMEHPVTTDEDLPGAAEQSVDTPFATSPMNLGGKQAWRALVAPAWFLLGVIVGLGAFFAIMQLTTKPAPTPPSLDVATVKQASRDGLIEAIQTLQAQSSGGATQAPQTVDRSAFAVRPANRLGNQDAKVMIVEYADFQCPFCGRHHQAVAPTLLKDYIETGKANFVYKHMAFLGPESVYAAVAAECAADQGKFWEFHDYLFEHQNGENQGGFEKDKLIDFGKALNLDMTRFEKCVRNDETIDRVRADTEEGQKFGVSSTPTFFVNGKPSVGLLSLTQFRQEIEQALNQ